MQQFNALSCALALGLAAVVPAQKPIIAEGSLKTLDPADRTAMPAIAPMSDTVRLASAAAGTSAAAGLADAWSGSLDVGGKPVRFVVGKSDAGLDLPDLVVVDLDGDGKFADVERIAIEATARDNRGTSVVTAPPVDLQLSLGSAPVSALATFSKIGDRDPSIAVLFPQYLEASLKLGDTDARVGIIDRDLDGHFGSAGDMWALTADGKRPSEYLRNAMGERCFQGGKLVSIKVEGDFVKVELADGKGPDPKDALAQRARAEHVWSARFDQEREGFVTARGLDTSRPLAAKPIEWRYVTFDEACTMAKQEKKLLFVDVMAFWCVWCYRMDYYTYPDKAVAEFMTENFIPVKILQEQDLVGDYSRVMSDKLGAKGIPAMGVFDSEGEVLHTISGWSKPEDFLEQLKTGLAAKK